MIKRLLAFVLLVTSAKAAVVTNYLTDTVGNPITTRVVFTPYTPTTIFGSTNVLGPSVGVACTNGIWWASVVPGWYLVQQQVSQPNIPIFVSPLDTTNSFSFFASQATNPIPTFGLTVIVLYTFTNFIGNGQGALTNDGTGTIGWFNNYAIRNATNAFTDTNYFSKAFTFSTNLSLVHPDFSNPENYLTTNAAFTFLAPLGVDTTHKTTQWTLMCVTNTTGSAVLATAPANCYSVGTPYITNLTYFWFHTYAGQWTSMLATPIF